MASIFVGCVGTLVKVTVKDDKDVVDLSTATTKTLLIQRPNESTARAMSMDFLTDGSDGILIYSLLSGDIDVAGDWTFQIYIETPSWQDHTTKFIVKVETPLQTS